MLIWVIDMDFFLQPITDNYLLMADIDKITDNLTFFIALLC